MSALDRTDSDNERQRLIAGKTHEEQIFYQVKDESKVKHAREIMRTIKGEPSLSVSLRRSSRRLSIGSSFRNLMQQGAPPEAPVAEGIVPLIQGKLPAGTYARPTPAVKSTPPVAPYRRFARHRSFHLWWLNEFRHWWKSSRLLVRLAGLETYATAIWTPLSTVNIMKRRGFKSAFKMGKRLGQGGGMRAFLKLVQPFTRTLRIVVAVWRWIEASKPRRAEVGVEEAMAFIGNRVSRLFARNASDFFSKFIVLPIIFILIEKGILQKHSWHSEVILVLLGLLRAISPYAASFYGSKIGRIITRQTFIHADNRWLPTQRIGQLNLHSTDADEPDEAGTNDSLVSMARKAAAALTAESNYQLTDKSLFQKRKADLKNAGFHIVGCGSGGYLSCLYRHGTITVLLHITPYGPSILGVMPLYIVLEKEDSVDTRGSWSSFVNEFIFSGPSVIEGYCYHGAFFSPYHFAELKERYDEELRCYDNACKLMSRPDASNLPRPPTDLKSLKAFIELGRRPRERKKNAARYRHLQGEIDKVAKQIKNMMHQKNSAGDLGCIAPKGVILYFEGLDCSGKSSTGGLIQAALERAGFKIGMRQYNRPPTPEQRLKPWMDRFERPSPVVPSPEDGEIPNDSIKESEACHDHQHTALVWDRGPAGDFVYGALAHADTQTRLDRYKEFKEFDAQCRRDSILFCKLLFVTDRDAIARTLGKRLAHRKIAHDLRRWLDANHDGEINREGLDEIEAHIDPTDFIAFNSYHNNLKQFASVARNTDEFSGDTWTSPWIVVSTKKRYPARLELLAAFSKQIDTFCVNTRTAPYVLKDVAAFFGIELEDVEEYIEVTDAYDVKHERKFHRFTWGTIVYFLLGLSLVYIYLANTFRDKGD